MYKQNQRFNDKLRFSGYKLRLIFKDAYFYTRKQFIMQYSL